MNIYVVYPTTIMRWLLVPLLLLVPTIIRAQTLPPAMDTALPPGFVITQLVVGMTLPVDMAFMPSGDILVAEKGQGDADGWSNIRLVRNGVLLPEPVITLSSTVANDSGIFGITPDPDFETNNFFYVWYATGSQAPNTPITPANRLIRLTLNSITGKADPASYAIILDNVPHSDWHNGGGLIFGADGTLFLSTGDAGRDETAQDLTALNGKILRIQPTTDGYTIPQDNPFIDVADARPEIYAVGLRNPFRITQNALSGDLYVGDVGNHTWEELNRVIAGANYGWPEREGPCPSGKLEPCKSAGAQFTDPVLYYLHSDSNNAGGAITGITFYAGDAYPEAYRSRLFFADFDQRYLGVGDINPSGFTIEPFFNGVDRVVDLEYFRNNIYFLDLRQGAIYMLFYSGSDNIAPTAHLTLDTDAGAVPLVVTFSAVGSVDPDGTALTYIWNPGDGTSEVETQEPSYQHVYTTDGTYNTTLFVRDIRGGTSAPVQLTVTIYSGEWPVISLTNFTDPARTLFHGGDVVHFSVLREEGTDDLDTEVPYTWQIDLIHNEHTHPILVGLTDHEGTLVIPADNHGGDVDIAYSVSLTMHTAEGQPVRVSRNLLPAVVQITIQSDPTGFGQVQVGNEVQSFPYNFAAITGTDYVLTAPKWLLSSENLWRFETWETEAFTTPRQITYTIPFTDQSVTALFTFERPAAQSHLPFVPSNRY